jgi:hypothetical protein
VGYISRGHAFIDRLLDSVVVRREADSHHDRRGSAVLAAYLSRQSRGRVDHCCSSHRAGFGPGSLGGVKGWTPPAIHLRCVFLLGRTSDGGCFLPQVVRGVRVSRSGAPGGPSSRNCRVWVYCRRRSHHHRFSRPLNAPYDNALERSLNHRGALCLCDSASCPAAQLAWLVSS